MGKAKYAQIKHSINHKFLYMKHAKQLGLFTNLFFAFFFILNSCSTSPNNNGGTNTTVIPVAPSNLTGTVVSNSRVDLSWTDNSTNETGFKVERRLDGGNYAVRGTVNADILNYSDTGLSPYTNYTYRVYSFNAAGNSITYSNEFSISTGGVPVLSTNTIDSITYTTAKSGGNITNDGRSPVTARGVVWSTSPNPTISLSTKTTDGSGTGTFTSNISSLTPGTNYYIRAYATNANGTGYGNELLLITNSYTLPVITTNAISGITQTAAVSGGNISNDGGAAVTARGVVWSTSSSPTIALNTKTVNGAGTGSFSSNITGLSTNTTYYVRAYATNSVGTAYGNEQTFNTPQVYSYNTGTNLTDIDGNVYPTITNNCGQTWISKNLTVSHYRNGDTIPQVTDNTQWYNLTTGAWCWYNNDSANYWQDGKLYNWYALNDPRGIAPLGWHVSSLSDWNRLVKCIDFDGDTSLSTNALSLIAGGAIKEAGTNHWASPNVGGTNSSGFTSLPSGDRTAGFGGPTNISSHHWTSNQANLLSGYVHNINANGAYVLPKANWAKYCGASIRLVKD